MTAPISSQTAPSDLSRPNQPARLSGWVMLVLILTLFASCSAANSAQQAANNARASRNDVGGSGLATTRDVDAMCRLLGAIAAKQGIEVTALFADPVTTSCSRAAIDAGAAAR